MNTTNLIGRLVAQPEQKQAVPVLVTEFTLAVKRSFKDKKTNQYESDFIRCKAFNKTAEIIAKNVNKGNQLGVIGSIQTGSYEKDGRKVYTTDVIVNSISFIESKSVPHHEAPQQTMQSAPIPELSDSDLPF